MTCPSMTRSYCTISSVLGEGRGASSSCDTTSGTFTKGMKRGVKPGYKKKKSRNPSPLYQYDRREPKPYGNSESILQIATSTKTTPSLSDMLTAGEYTFGITSGNQTVDIPSLQINPPGLDRGHS